MRPLGSTRGLAAEPIPAVDFAHERVISLLVRLGWSEFECSVGSLAVVVVGVDAQHVLEVPAIEDQQPVETFGSYCADEAFGDRPSLSTSGETLTIEESMALRARTENAEHVGDEHEWSWSGG